MALNFQSQTYYGCGNTLATNNGDALIFALKTFLKARGWTVPQSSDGTTLNQNGTDQITSVGSGAGGMSNANAWFVLQEPGVYGGRQRQFLFYKSSAWSTPNDGCFRNIVYSVQGFSTTSGFASGSVTATNPPIAFDGLHLNHSSYVGNSQSTAQWATIMSNTPSTQLIPYTGDGNTYAFGPITYYFCASDTAPYFWYILGYTKSTNTSSGPSVFLCYDPLAQYDSSDGDPAMIQFRGFDQITTSVNGGNSIANLGGAAAGYNTGWYKYQTFSSKTDAQNKVDTLQQTRKSTFGGLVGLYIPAQTTLPNTNNAANSGFLHHPAVYPSASPKIATMSAFYFSNAYGPGSAPAYNYYYVKGASQFLKYPINPVYGNTLVTVSTSKDYMALGSVQSPSHVLIPWNGSSFSF
jgi:hypothetical protein